MDVYECGECELEREWLVKGQHQERRLYLDTQVQIMLRSLDLIRKAVVNCQTCKL